MYLTLLGSCICLSCNIQILFLELTKCEQTKIECNPCYLNFILQGINIHELGAQIKSWKCYKNCIYIYIYIFTAWRRDEIQLQNKTESSSCTKGALNVSHLFLIQICRLLHQWQESKSLLWRRFFFFFVKVW